MAVKRDLERYALMLRLYAQTVKAITEQHQTNAWHSKKPKEKPEKKKKTSKHFNEEEERLTKKNGIDIENNNWIKITSQPSSIKDFKCQELQNFLYASYLI